MKVIFHVVEADKWELTLSNVRDVLREMPVTKIEIIAMSKAASIFKRYSGIDFEDLIDNPNVTITIGKQALDLHNIKVEELPNHIKTVDLVITRIVKLQNEGYGYIRI